ncbi:hypothetical protein AWB77_06823 [Caballeronia fortuita]|uniref:Uncharacterized protein n=1 Tax=Caballeronia fortuita TaxID=1777138 RepID=A0A158EAZ7_9BURK|nr:hypothetical protein [Caballeronia fortuita]SAL03586.1 hypothetical protein AWB77_06823 [Caballeronia fortuita]
MPTDDVLQSDSNDGPFQPRALSEAFVRALENEGGLLHPLLTYFKSDHTLMMGLRGTYVNVYYRGGSLMKVACTSAACDRFVITFDPNYGEHPAVPTSSSVVSEAHDLQLWLERIPYLKLLMDRFFARRPKQEREFQQLVARENNQSVISNETDYFIADIEYAHGSARFDMLAIRWLTKDRKFTNRFRLAVIEMKYGDGALEGVSGLAEHLHALEETLRIPGARQALTQVAVDLFNQLTRLGLVNIRQKKQLEVSSDAPEIVFLLANHHPGASRLGQLLSKVDKTRFSPDTDTELKFAVSSFAGYGMHKACMYDLGEFSELVANLEERYRSKGGVAPDE